MKKALFLLPLFLLTACQQTSSSSSPSLPSSSQPSSTLPSSEEVSTSESSLSSSELSSSSSSSTEKPLEEKVQDFIKELPTFDGHPNRITAVNEMLYSFATSDDMPLEITGKDTFTLARYRREDAGDILVRKGVQEIGDSLLHYEMQTFYDEKNFYRLTDYEEAEEADTKEVIPFDPEWIEENLSLLILKSESNNLSQLLDIYLNPEEDVFALFDLPESISSDGTTSFSYILGSYVPGTTINESREVHETEVTAENGIATEIKMTVTAEMYADGECLNKMTSDWTYTIEQGEYPLFDGVVLNPADFEETN